jgi:hypothetical protein
VNRRAIILVLVGLVLGMTGWWLTTYFGFTTERIYVGYSGEARRDPWFAARLLLERMGKRVTQQQTLASGAALPTDATVLLPGLRSNLDPPLVRALLAWVEGGGQLVAGVDSPFVRDPLLEAIGVEARWPEQDETRKPGALGVEQVGLPGGTPLRVQFRSSVVLAHDGQAPAWRHAGPDGDRILAFERGRGRILVFSTLQPFTNTGLDEFDHAALLWRLLQDTGEVIMIRRLESVTLLAWLRQHALAALVALAALIVLWLWRVVPRFGPLRPAQAAQRRSLLEHLNAVGRYQADHGQLGRLLQRVRADAQDTFSRCAPLCAALEGPARLREASRLTRLRPRELMQAFTGAIASRHEFSNAVRTLAEFRRRLARGPTQRE